ncbi:hypothetical protein AB205_0154790, partial [Aquarana catesbeiana]
MQCNSVEKSAVQKSVSTFTSMKKNCCKILDTNVSYPQKKKMEAQLFFSTTFTDDPPQEKVQSSGNDDFRA